MSGVHQPLPPAGRPANTTHEEHCDGKFSIPLTGLDADSKALNTIANNLANMSTTAFKAQTTNFSDLFYEQIGSTGAGDPIQIGAGVQVASNETDFTAGSPNSTGNALDVALEGQRILCRIRRKRIVRVHACRQLFAVVVRRSCDGKRAERDGVSGRERCGEYERSIDDDQYSSRSSGAAAGYRELHDDGQSQFDRDCRNAIPRGRLRSMILLARRTSSSPLIPDRRHRIPGATRLRCPPPDFTLGVSTPITGTLNFDTSGNLASITTGGVTTPVGTAAGDVLFDPAGLCGTIRWRGRHEHELEPSGIRQHANHQSGRSGLRRHRHHTGWFRPRASIRVSRLGRTVR